MRKTAAIGPFLIFLMSCASPTSIDVSSKVQIVKESVDCVATGCEQARHAVVFVHGLTGSQSTWETNGFNWPKQLANDPQFASYDVYQIEYESHRLRTSANLTQINEGLVPLLHEVSAKGYQSIAFIGHSLGGNIVRRYLQTVKSRFGHDKLNQFRLVILLGTPMGGSHLADIFRNISRNAQVRALVEIDDNDYLQFLDEQMKGTNAKHTDLGCPSLRFFAAYEKKPSSIGIVVPEESATLDSWACEGFDVDHSNLAKPKTNQDDLYVQVGRLLSACLEDRRGVCPKPVFQDRCSQVNSQGLTLREVLDRSAGTVNEPCQRTWTESLE